MSLTSLDIINALGKPNRGNFDELKKFTELEIGKFYSILKLKKIKTRFGERLMVFSDGFRCYLPLRLASIDNEILDDLNKKPHLGFRRELNDAVEFYQSEARDSLL
uniref:Uncharacterized protein n=1 Tax=Lygus hesperus TaxID=30085 RepID=A0A0A9XAU5_LYGHE